MYTQFYGLSDKPFSLTPDPAFLFLSRGHKEALAHLTYGVESKSGFVMVTGDVGAGKTTLLRTLIRNLGEDVILSQVANTRVSYKELLELILEDFGLNPQGLSKTNLLSMLNDFLIEKHGAGKNCVLVVDEAQNLGVNTLEGLRMLSNLETEKSKLLHIILAGQPGLRATIDSPQLEQLRQRITVRYHLGPLSPGEVGEYIRHRVAKVATDEARAPVFPDEVIPAIHEATGGIPRLVNVLCDGALLHGYVEEARVIGADVVGEVAAQIVRDQRGTEPPEEAEPQALDPSVEARIAQIEARLEGMLSAVAHGPRAARPDRGDLAAEAGALRKRERDLEGRLVDLARREKEFNERLTRLKDEWKKRMSNVEETRQSLLGGELALPPLRVYAFDNDPRIQNALNEVARNAGIECEVFGDYGSFESSLRAAEPGGCFPVAVLGSVADDGENVARVTGIANDLAHVPTVFLSDIDLSTIRRKIFAAGANYFLEKPNGRARSFAGHREATEHMKADLLRVIRTVHRQQRAILDRMAARDAEEKA